MYVFPPVFIISAVCLAQTSAPLISFDKTHHDFGKMSPAKNVSHKFNITNKGRDTLIFHTTSKEIPTLQFIIEWDTISAITASPKRVVWNGYAGTELLTVVSLGLSFL